MLANICFVNSSALQWLKFGLSVLKEHSLMVFKNRVLRKKLDIRSKRRLKEFTQQLAS